MNRECFPFDENTCIAERVIRPQNSKTRTGALLRGSRKRLFHDVGERRRRGSFLGLRLSSRWYAGIQQAIAATVMILMSYIFVGILPGGIPLISHKFELTSCSSPQCFDESIIMQGTPLAQEHVLQHSLYKAIPKFKTPDCSARRNTEQDFFWRNGTEI